MKRFTTREIKEMDIWPSLKKVIDNSIKQYNGFFPNDKVKLIQHLYHWTIEINGDPVMEIDAEDLIGRN